MSQTYTADCFASGHAAQTDLQNMEDNFAALKSCFSGAGAPSNTVAGMLWFDTTQLALKQRNNADAAWVGLMHGDTSQKVWIYRNAAMDGWAVDSTAALQDKILAIKGGATYTTGAATAGSWTVSGITQAAHNHQWYDVVAGVKDKSWDSSGSVIDLNVATKTLTHIYANNVESNSLDPDCYTDNQTPTISSDGTWRAAAAVGTVQYLNL